MKVTLEREEKARCAGWAMQRVAENKGRSDIADYDPNRFNLNNFQNNALALMCELAFGKLLGVSENTLQGENPDIWAPFVESKNYSLYLRQPDWYGKFEIRRANRIHSPIPVRRKDVDANAYVVQGFVDYVQNEETGRILVPDCVEFLGWADAANDWDNASLADFSTGDTRLRYKKRDMEDLPLVVPA